jgi:pimeloyl-ACP methyl ester carboxylesterase
MDTPDQLSLSGIVEGETGHPVMLVHDINASLNDWEELIPLLVEAGFVAHACDLFGHGQSPYPLDPALYHAQLHLTALRKWIDSFNLTRAPILIGHGFGAYLCLRYTIGHPYRVFKLVLINPLLSPEQIAPAIRFLHRHPRIEKFAEQVVPVWTEHQMLGIRKDYSPELTRRIITEARCASPNNFNIMPGIADLTSSLYEVPTRSLFLFGREDSLLDMTQIPDLIENRSEFTCLPIPGLGHRPHLEAPQITNQLIVNFLHGF